MNELQPKIREWISIDNEIAILNEKIREKREKKREINEYVFQYLKEKNTPKIRINIPDGHITTATTNTYNPISLKLLLSAFTEYFNDEEKALQLLEFIKNKREIITTNELKRTHKK
jgi:rRNA processing protein Krr1/Pno1